MLRLDRRGGVLLFLPRSLLIKFDKNKNKMKKIKFFYLLAPCAHIVLN